jgi:hypothetical protein
MSDFDVLWKKVKYYLSTLEMQIWSNDDRGRKYQVDQDGWHLSNVLRRKEMEIWMKGFLEGVLLEKDRNEFFDLMPNVREPEIKKLAGFQNNALTQELLFSMWRHLKHWDNAELAFEFKKKYGKDMRYEQYKIKG